MGNLRVRIRRFKRARKTLIETDEGVGGQSRTALYEA